MPEGRDPLAGLKKSPGGAYLFEDLNEPSTEIKNAARGKTLIWRKPTGETMRLQGADWGLIPAEKVEAVFGPMGEEAPPPVAGGVPEPPPVDPGVQGTPQGLTTHQDIQAESERSAADAAARAAMEKEADPWRGIGIADPARPGIQAIIDANPGMEVGAAIDQYATENPDWQPPKEVSMMGPMGGGPPPGMMGAPMGPGGPPPQMAMGPGGPPPGPMPMPPPGGAPPLPPTTFRGRPPLSPPPGVNPGLSRMG